VWLLLGWLIECCLTSSDIYILFIFRTKTSFNNI
jgi:hypothetical protein